MLKELKDDHKELSKTSSKHREETLQWQAETSARLNTIEIDLREHKEGVINNRKLIGTADKRLQILEQPRIIVSSLKSILITSGKVIGAIVAIGGAVAWIKSLF